MYQVIDLTLKVSAGHNIDPKHYWELKAEIGL